MTTRPSPKAGRHHHPFRKDTHMNPMGSGSPTRGSPRRERSVRGAERAGRAARAIAPPPVGRVAGATRPAGRRRRMATPAWQG